MATESSIESSGDQYAKTLRIAQFKDLLAAFVLHGSLTAREAEAIAGELDQLGRENAEPGTLWARAMELES